MYLWYETICTALECVVTLWLCPFQPSFAVLFRHAIQTKAEFEKKNNSNNNKKKADLLECAITLSVLWGAWYVVSYFKMYQGFWLYLYAVEIKLP